MRHLIFILTFLLVALLSLQCSDSATVNQNENPPDDIVSPTDVEKELVEAGNSFGLKLFREIVAEEPGTNIFISPLSVALALGMTYNGAAGDTREAMKQTLELNGLSLIDINASYKSLIETLSGLDPKVMFEIANSIWYREGIPVKDDFINLNLDYFNAEVAALNFNDNASCDIINNWVDEKTHGKISEIIQPPISLDAIMFLINAIYFKGDWTYQFDPEYTRENDFNLMDGTTNRCNMMTIQDTFSYYGNDIFQAVDLPYGDGDYSMTIFLPNADYGEDVNTLAAKMTKENLETWLSGFEEHEVLLYMPKFEVEYSIQLNKALTALGMGIAFDGSRSDFSNIADMDLFINSVRHKTYVKVDEEGTEAAAVTIVEISATFEGPSHKTVLLNQPFLFLIRERASNTILFMGKITNPGLLE